MAAKKKGFDAGKGEGKIDAGKGSAFPRKVVFDGATVMVDKRADGRFSLRWREGGSWKKTTRNGEAEALSWAAEKARKLSRGTGERWIKAGEAEALDGLRAIAIAEGLDLGRVVAEVAGAAEALGGLSRLREAAVYFMGSGTGAVLDLSFYQALDRVRAEYDFSRGATRNTMRVALDGMRRLIEDKRLSEITRADVEGFVFEPGRSIRTQRNRISQAGTFFVRCKLLDLWPAARALPTVAIKKPRLPDKAPEIFTPKEGKKLLAAVRKDCPRYVPYLILAGWLGCRPSECLRLRWGAFDLVNGILHLSSDVVGKTKRERWVAMDERARVLLLSLQDKAKEEGLGDDEDKVCFTHSREEISKLARAKGLPWPADVLRHSAITYELQLSGNDFNKTAEKMGNSPAVIESNYRRPIPAGLGEIWQNLLE
jgi:integrase